MCLTEPRSTRTHCGSDAWLDQRVPKEVSLALSPSAPQNSTLDATVGRPAERRNGPAGSCSKTASTLLFPSMSRFGAGDAPVSVLSANSGDTILAGQSRWYLVLYRDALVVGGCPAASNFNVTQTAEVVWLP